MDAAFQPCVCILFLILGKVSDLRFFYPWPPSKKVEMGLDWLAASEGWPHQKLYKCNRFLWPPFTYQSSQNKSGSKPYQSLSFIILDLNLNGCHVFLFGAPPSPFLASTTKSQGGHSSAAPGRSLRVQKGGVPQNAAYVDFIDPSLISNKPNLQFFFCEMVGSMTQ